MTDYVIGDVQGCFGTLQDLLATLRFEPTRDRAWLVGDLVNRGPRSLETLRWAKAHDASGAVQVVLGNHDLHLIRRALGISERKPRDTLDEVLAAPDRDELVSWLRTRPLIARAGAHVLVHAGFAPQWTLAEAETEARAVEALLRGDGAKALLSYKSDQSRPRWSDGALGVARQALALRILTNIRVCDEQGRIESSFSGPPGAAPAGFAPWYAWSGRRTREQRIVIGHWSALGLHRAPNLTAIDTGCVWGQTLTALRLEDGVVIGQPSREVGAESGT